MYVHPVSSSTIHLVRSIVPSEDILQKIFQYAFYSQKDVDKMIHFIRETKKEIHSSILKGDYMLGEEDGHWVKSIVSNPLQDREIEVHMQAISCTSCGEFTFLGTKGYEIPYRIQCVCDHDEDW